MHSIRHSGGNCWIGAWQAPCPCLSHHAEPVLKGECALINAFSTFHCLILKTSKKKTYSAYTHIKMMHNTISLIVLSHQSAAVSDTDQWNNHVVFLNCFKSLLRGQEAHSTTFMSYWWKAQAELFISFSVGFIYLKNRKLQSSQIKPAGTRTLYYFMTEYWRC